MNDEELERQLRSQRGPRDEGYTPTHLPGSLEHRRSDGAHPSRLVRAVAFAGMALAGALAVALLGGVFSGGNPGVGSGSSGEPSPSGRSACGPQDVSLVAELWGGAAGSRGTVVTVTLAGEHGACMLGKGLAAEMVDANGGVLVTTAEAEPGESVLLVPGASFTIGISWSNWCGPAPEEPKLVLKMSGWESFEAVSGTAVSIPIGYADDPVPPCMGSTEPTVLSWTGLEAQPEPSKASGPLR